MKRVEGVERGCRGMLIDCRGVMMGADAERILCGEVMKLGEG